MRPWGSDPAMPGTPQEAWASEWRRLALDWRRWGIRTRMDAVERAMRALGRKVGSDGPPPIDFLRAGVIPDDAELDVALGATAEVAGSWLGHHLPHLNHQVNLDQLLLEGYLDAERGRLGHPLSYDAWLWGAESCGRYHRAWQHVRHDPTVERQFILWGVVNSCSESLFQDALWEDESAGRPVSVGFDPALVSGLVHNGRRRIVLPMSLCEGSLIGATGEVVRLLAARTATREPEWAHWAVAAAQAGYGWVCSTEA